MTPAQVDCSKSHALMTPSQFTCSKLHVLMTPAQFTYSKSYSPMTPVQFTCSNIHSSKITNLLETSNHHPEMPAYHQFCRKLIQLNKQKHISVAEPTASPILYSHDKNISHSIMPSSATEYESLPWKLASMPLVTPKVDPTINAVTLQPTERKPDNSISEPFLTETFDFSKADKIASSESLFESDECSILAFSEPESPICSKICNYYNRLFGDSEKNNQNLLSELYNMLSDPSNSNLRENGAITDVKIIAKLRELFSLNGCTNVEIISTKEATTQENIPPTWGTLNPCTTAFSIHYDRVAAVISGQENDNYYSEEANPIGVFWDLDNMMVQKKLKPAHVVGNIRRIFMNSHWEGDFVCACDIWTRTSNMALVDEILAEEVDVHCVCVDKNDANFTLVSKIERFSQLHGPAGTIVIITSDFNFANVIHRMRNEFKHYVILVHSPNCPEEMKALANETIKFKELTETWFGPLVHDWVPSNIDANGETGTGPKYPRYPYKKVFRV